MARQVELINNHKFVKVALDENFKTFVINIVALKVMTIAM